MELLWVETGDVTVLDTTKYGIYKGIELVWNCIIE